MTAPSSPEPVIFSWSGFWRGALKCLPLQFGLAPFGLITGVTAQVHGLSLAEALLMSGAVFAGSAQLLTLGAWTAPAALAAATLTTLMVNLRFVMMGPLMAPWLDHLKGWRRWLPLFFLVEHNWALGLKEIERGGKDAAFFVGAGMTLWVAWLITTAIGFLVGSIAAPIPGHPLFFAALAVFITLLVPMWRGRHDAVPWLVAAAVAFTVSRLLPGTSWHIVAGAFVGAATGYVQERLWTR